MNGTGEGSAARVRYVEEHGGRGLATARSCSAGDVLVEERPVVSCTVQKKETRAVPTCGRLAYGVKLPTFLKDHRALWPYDPAFLRGLATLAIANDESCTKSRSHKTDQGPEDTNLHAWNMDETSYRNV
ncbi:hypothetical protein DIPPA_19362 [Diplonema papillatum]|nr:hypothetical protein DIPPA_19362 [Diplonema papillatum]